MYYLIEGGEQKNEYLTGYLPVEQGKEVYLKLKPNDGKVQFFYGYEEDEQQKIGPCVDVGFCWMKPVKRDGSPEP